MNNEKTTIHAEVLLSSGTSQQTTNYKIELGDDVIAEIKRLKDLINDKK